MKRSYMSVFQEITQQKISSSKKERLRVFKARPQKRYKSIDNLEQLKEPEAKPKENRVAYIDNAIKIMRESERTLEENPSLPIRIDNAYGDYAMSMFRRKDKKKRLEDIPKLFTNEFQSKILECFPPGWYDRLVADLIKGKVRASSLVPESEKKSEESERIYKRRKSINKDLCELNEEMRYEYFVEEESFGGSRIKGGEKEDQMRASSMDKLMELKPEGLLPSIHKVRKGLIFKSQTHPMKDY